MPTARSRELWLSSRPWSPCWSGQPTWAVVFDDARDSLLDLSVGVAPEGGCEWTPEQEEIAVRVRLRARVADQVELRVIASPVLSGTDESSQSAPRDQSRTLVLKPGGTLNDEIEIPLEVSAAQYAAGWRSCSVSYSTDRVEPWD